MLSFVQLDKPHIDIELYGTDTNIAPIDKVHIMDEDSFEQFTLEWLFGCKKSKYSSIKRIGGAGDKGRDVVGYYSDGTVDYYQCKHYNTGLAPTNYYLECKRTIITRAEQNYGRVPFAGLCRLFISVYVPGAGLPGARASAFPS